MVSPPECGEHQGFCLEAHALLQGRVGLYLFLIIFLVYLLTTSGTTIYVTLDGLVRLEVIKSITSTLTADVPAKYGAGFALQGREGRFYDPHEVGHTLLSIPFFVVGQALGNPQFFLSLMNPLALAWTCVFFFRLCGTVGYSLSTSVRLTLILALCTQLWPESKSPFDHALESLFCLAAFYHACLSCTKETRSTLVVCGAFLGAAIATRTISVLFGAPIAFYVISYTWRRQTVLAKKLGEAAKQFCLLLAGLAPGLALALGYNSYRFGSMLTTGYAGWSQLHKVDLFSNPIWKGMLGLTVSPGKGLFFYCPIVLLSILNYKKFLRWKKELAVAIALLLALYSIVLGKYIAWHGDFAWGPRYLTVLLPYLILPLGIVFERRSRTNPFRRTLLKAAVSIGFVVQLMAVSIDMNVFFLRAQTAGVLNRDFAWRTYSIPYEFYFDPENSPLVSRIYEIRDALQNQRPLETDSNPEWSKVITTPQREAEIDFWWKGLFAKKEIEFLPAVSLLLIGILFSASKVIYLLRSSRLTGSESRTA